jgi:hypothetical protein
MPTSFSTLELLHRLCANHRQAVLASTTCGCFYCQKTFASSEVEDWVDDEEGTALCPRCGIDSVIPESETYKLTPDLLRDMNEYWFQRSISLPRGPSALQSFILKIQPLRRRITWLFKGS